MELAQAPNAHDPHDGWVSKAMAGRTHADERHTNPVIDLRGWMRHWGHAPCNIVRQPVFHLPHLSSPRCTAEEFFRVPAFRRLTVASGHAKFKFKAAA